MNQSPTKAVVEFLSNRKRFRLSDVVRKSQIDRRKLLRVLEKLRQEGYLAIIDEERVRPGYNEHGPARRDPRYELIKDISKRSFIKAPNKRDSLWRTLRHLRKFSCGDLIRITGCNERTVGAYVNLLATNSYLRFVGRRGREKVWFLINDTGPTRPKIKGL